MIGSGKYDYLCEFARGASKAKAIAVIVVGGEEGHGFSVSGELEYLEALPAVFERVAASMRADLAQIKGTK